MKEQFLDLFELRVSVEPEEVLIRNWCYYVKFTGQNYISVRLTPEKEEQELLKRKYIGSLMSRVPADEILKVQRIGFHDGYTCIGRSVYYLEGQQETAINLIRTELNLVIDRFKTNVDKMHSTWFNRKTK